MPNGEIGDDFFSFLVAVVDSDDELAPLTSALLSDVH